MNKENSASRILKLLRAAKNHPDNTQNYKVWADVFDINESNQNRLHIEVSRCLALLQNEIDIVIKTLNLQDEDEFGCYILINSISEVIAIQTIMSDWKHQKPKLTREVFLSLGYCREVLPDEENSINSKDLEEIKSLVASLKEQLEKSSLTEDTKQLLQKYIDRINQALHNYKIEGVSSLQNALSNVVGDVLYNKDTISSSNESEEVKLFGRVIEKTSEIADKAIKLEKVVSSSQKLIGYASKLIEVIN